MTRFYKLYPLLFLALSSCAQQASTWSAVTCPSFGILIKGDPHLDPDSTGHPTNATIHVYQLVSDNDFRKADLATLLTAKNAETGQQTILTNKELMYNPAPYALYAVGWSSGLDSRTRLIGAVVQFDDEAQSTFRATYRFDQSWNCQANVVLTARSVSIVQGIAPKPPITL